MFVAAKAALPESVGEHDDLVLSRLIFIRREGAAKQRPRPQDRADRWRTSLVRMTRSGSSVPREVPVGAVTAAIALRKTVLCCLQSRKAPGEAYIRLAWLRRLPHAARAARARRKAAASSSTALIDAEDRRVRPDAEREREHGHGGEAGVFQQLAEGEFEVVHGSLSVVSCWLLTRFAKQPSDRLWQRGALAATLTSSSVGIRRSAN